MKYLKTFEYNKPEFKVGDSVKCVDTFNTKNLKKNTLYTISVVEFDPIENDTFYQIEGFPDCTYRESRFEKATQIDLDQDKYNL